ncbi:DUF3073 domain-containing protein [Streptomyces hoynatensis]|uniref:DUF3073 domain-containing protein n=1 Tax=Streptomyces hoynatensis TaxID=1141874 RepID=A0A3A9YWG8_9ACTN|nr:DUF3073 domain-containing protein [Streptomyces hoynatensis]RKN39567.1 DUF3073 domain-containing protein [Streptomyces hoynatensis]
MGRGRAKAKQTKVARQLKYNSGRTDLSRLAEELGASTTPDRASSDRFEDDEELDDDLYTRYAEMYSDEEEDDEDEASPDASAKRRRA